MINIPFGGLYLIGVSPLVYHISYGVGSALLVLRSDGYARCHETAGRATVRILRFFIETKSCWDSEANQHHSCHEQEKKQTKEAPESQNDLLG